LDITRKGGKVVTIPLAPRTARAIDLAIGEPCDGPIFLAADGRRLDRHGAGWDRPAGRPPRRDRQARRPAHAAHAFITAAVDAGVLRDVQEAASHAGPAPQCVMTGPGDPWTGTPLISPPPTSQVPAANN
jgi:integrase/recombinase XerD